MDTLTLKTEISQIINHLPDDLLVELLEYLRKVDNVATPTIERTQHLRKILQEDCQLLEKLAK